MSCDAAAYEPSYIRQFHEVHQVACVSAGLETQIIAIFALIQSC